MKKSYRFILGLIGIFAYLIFLPRDLNPALNVSPVAAYVYEAERNKPGEPLSFAGISHVGFLNPDGSPRHVEKVRYAAAAASWTTVNYDSVSQNLVLSDPDGGLLMPIETSGYPFFIDERLMVISTDRLRLKEFSAQGELLWERSFPSLVTTVAGGGERTIVGQLNGSFLFLDEEGEIIYRFAPEEGRIQVAYSALYDPITSLYLLVAGIDPQTAYVIEERGGEFRLMNQRPLGTDFRRNLLGEIPLQSLFVLESEQGVLLLDQLTYKERALPLSGRLVDMVGFDEYRLLVFLTRSREGFRLELRHDQTDYLGEIVVDPDEEELSLMAAGERLFLFFSDAILVYQIERR